jgi:hypothetical protein
LELDVEFDVVPPVAAPYPRPSIIFPNKRQNAGKAAPNAVAAIDPIIKSV